MKRLAAGLAVSLLMTASALAADRTMIVLDASGSMWAQIEGTSRIEIARASLDEVLNAASPSLELGFMAYGHRSKGACDDIEVLVEPAEGTGPAIIEAAANLNPKGKTPITAAVRQAAEALRYTEDKATVILITDGLETCDADPCALASELEQSGVDFKVDVVGFGLTDSEGRQVACLADNTGGQYFTANDAAGLGEALTRTVAQVVVEAPEPAPEVADEEPPADRLNFTPTLTLSAGGEAITDSSPRWDIFVAGTDGRKGKSLATEYGAPLELKLAPGDYVVAATWDRARIEQPVSIGSGVATPQFNLNAGRLILHPRPAEGLDVDGEIAVRVTYAGDNTTYYGETSAIVPAGDIKLNLKLDVATLETVVPLAAGETAEHDLAIGAGHVTANASYAEGGEAVTDGDLTFRAVAAKKKIDGSRAEFGTRYGSDTKLWMLPGDYVMQVKLDQAKLDVPFTVTAGEQTDVDVPLNAGVAAISAPGAKKIDVFGTKKDIKGQRVAFGYSYDAEFQTTLPQGDYVAVVTVDDAGQKTETLFSVVAGERTELTVGE